MYRLVLHYDKKLQGTGAREVLAGRPMQQGSSKTTASSIDET